MKPFLPYNRLKIDNVYPKKLILPKKEHSCSLFLKIFQKKIKAGLIVDILLKALPDKEYKGTIFPENIET
ncbi:MAG: hypothetical protein JST86_06885 [Bacteroidetes bacterium]|nr:hypothetical protein [Bacteroidota bacterium]